jgi:hypothetical protein
MHPRVRIHEVEIRDHARELDVLVHCERAETVVCGGVGREQKTRAEERISMTAFA